jgi:hypothetical protein
MSFTPSTYPLAFNNLPIQVSDPDAPANQATLLNTLQLNSTGHSTELTSTGILSDETTTTWSSLGSSASNTVALLAPPDSTTLSVINKVVIEDTANTPTHSVISLSANGFPTISTNHNSLDGEILNLSLASNETNLLISSHGPQNSPMVFYHNDTQYLQVYNNNVSTVMDLVPDIAFTNLNIGNSACAVDASTALSFKLPNNSTASTQAQADNSTKVATTSYVDTAVSNLNIYPVPVVMNGITNKSVAETNAFNTFEIPNLVVGKYYSINGHSLFACNTKFSIGSIFGGLYDGSTVSANVIRGIQVVDPRNSFQTSIGYRFSENVSGVFQATATSVWFVIGYTSSGNNVNFDISYNISVVQI